MITRRHTNARHGTRTQVRACVCECFGCQNNVRGVARVSVVQPCLWKVKQSRKPCACSRGSDALKRGAYRTVGWPNPPLRVRSMMRHDCDALDGHRHSHSIQIEHRCLTQSLHTGSASRLRCKWRTSDLKRTFELVWRHTATDVGADAEAAQSRAAQRCGRQPPSSPKIEKSGRFGN
jgi:hypothetical protein